jgi:beta-glucosidase
VRAHFSKRIGWVRLAHVSTARETGRILRRFPPGFHWGSSMSAHQVEGGNRANDWWRFEQQPGAIRGGATSGDACRHWERFDEDFARARAYGHTMHRLSLEWSRLEPAPGVHDPAAVAHYHEVLASLRRHGLTPLVTLHHFTNPLWIADAGGWEERATLDRFDAFVRFCAREYGAEVDWWCTVNEPEVYAFRGYSEGGWPPARRDDGAALRVFANLLEAHGRAYRILHAEDRTDADGDGRAAIVGFAKNLTQFVPDRPWFPPDLVRALFEDRIYNAAPLRAAVDGTIALAIPGVPAVHRHLPALERSLDYIGINYYTRWRVRAFARVPHVARRGAPVTDLGWEIWPAGLARAARRGAAATGAPVLITEHGFADARDALRPRALAESLLELGRAIEGGTPVLGYLHWSLMDNFEWAEGYAGRFGLERVDFADPARPRTPRPSAGLLARIARANAIDEAVVRDAGAGLPA